MREFRGTTFTSATVLLLFLFLLCSANSAIDEMPMQLLSRSELVRVAGYGEERLSSVLVTGTVVCHACVIPVSHVSAAKVAVGCKMEGKRRIDWVQGVTDDYGEFIVDLPSHLHAIPRMDKDCMVRILRLPMNSPCRLIASRVRPQAIHLSSIGNGIRVYTAGVVSLNHNSEHHLRGCSKMQDIYA
ncbi:uncharacterized protein [Typha angustifolia]|uniref:uncharacterized protein n=1 Tax=Typha angustifolia TaxID=59011 RepID=UPI003C2CA429